MPAATNYKLAPTTSDQSDNAGYELRKERIETAFTKGFKSTAPLNNGAASEMFSPKLNRMTAPQGVRWSVPVKQSRLIGFVTEQRWQGHITSVSPDGKFWVRLYDQSAQDAETEEAQFDTDEVSDLMKHLVKPGGILFWDIGFQVEPSGQRIRQSILSFPMIPTISEKEKAAAKLRAKERFSALGWDRAANDEAKYSKNASE
ncbi:hypothetical protein [Bradyrhizobium sp. RT7b]|uniref:hypothetical protein n=1 Tax=unclassified Bradyrhizobium TaxID=2631580 RepID=UPI00339502D1